MLNCPGWDDGQAKALGLTLAGFEDDPDINAYRIGTLKNTPLDEAPRRKVNKLESGYEIVLDNSSALG
jgi:hypothetical protein